MLVRYKSPTYQLFAGESFPGTIGGQTYGLLNVVSEGTGEDGSAPVDGPSPSGVNAGTFLTGFGDPGAAKYINRGTVALAKNIDAIDDLLRASAPKATCQLGTGSGATYINVAGDVFVGDSGATAATLGALTDLDGYPVLSSAGSVITITDITNTGGTSVVSQGFVSGARFVLSAAIPSGAPYTLWYGTRTSIARTVERERHVNWEQVMRALTQASIAVQSVTHGLDERYRRATHRRAGATPALDTAGSGAVIYRDGPAPESAEPATPPAATYGSYVDTYLAQWKSTLLAPSVDVSTWSATTLGGASGFVYELNSAPFGPLYMKNTRQHAGLLGIVPRDMRSATFVTAGPVTQTFYTYVNPTLTTGVLNPTSGSDTTSRSTVELPSGTYFSYSSRTAIKLGVDLLLVTVDGVVEAYIITALVSSTRATLSTLAGVAADFGATATSDASFQWVQVSRRASPHGEEVFATVGISTNSLHGAEVDDGLPKYYAASTDPADVSAASYTGDSRSTRATALAWGGFGTTGVPSIKGRLLGDGGLEGCGPWRGGVRSAERVVTVGSTGSITWSPYDDFTSSNRGNQLAVNFTAAATLTVYVVSGAVAAGDEVAVVVSNTAGGAVSLVLDVAGCTVKWSGNDNVLPTDAGAMLLLRIRFATIAGALYGFVTRTDY